MTDPLKRAAPVMSIRRLGRLSYEEGRRMQRDLVDRRARGEIDDVLLLLEHDPVITVGRGGSITDAPESGPPVVEVERGGEATWHGPGQLVGYPIVSLPLGERDLHRHLRNIEEGLIQAISRLGVQSAERRPPHTGVWIGERKVASIGVAVRRWVTYHGFALNVRVDMAAFRGFRPCGLDAAVMTSLDQIAAPAPAMDQVMDAVAACLPAALGRSPQAMEWG